jgi:MEDS: MEthanogen/methylotroph, DcmR Sensory domain
VRHTAFVYDEESCLEEKLAPWLNAALSNGQPVVVVLERRKSELVATALGSGADRVSFFDPDIFLTRPETALARFDAAFHRLMRAGATAVCVYGEPPWRAEREWDAWISFEAVFNRAFADQPGWALCGYDASRVPERALDGAFATHPEILTDHWAHNPRYQTPEDVVRSHTPTPASVPGLHGLLLDRGAQGLHDDLRAELQAAGVSELDTKSMLIAVDEVLADARRYSETPWLRVGRAGARFVCEIGVAGPVIDDPLAGFLPPRPAHPDRGELWVARQLTRQLDLLHSARGRTVRLWI